MPVIRWCGEGDREDGRVRARRKLLCVVLALLLECRRGGRYLTVMSLEIRAEERNLCSFPLLSPLQNPGHQLGIRNSTEVGEGNYFAILPRVNTCLGPRGSGSEITREVLAPKDWGI